MVKSNTQLERSKCFVTKLEAFQTVIYLNTDMNILV